MLINPSQGLATQSDTCEDLEKACAAAIKNADELIGVLDGKIKLQQELLDNRAAQIETLIKENVDLKNPPWYADYKVTFLIGFITAGGIIYGISK